MVVGLGGTQHLDSAVPVSLAGTMTRSRCTLIAVIKSPYAVGTAESRSVCRSGAVFVHTFWATTVKVMSYVRISFVVIADRRQHV